MNLRFCLSLVLLICISMAFMISEERKPSYPGYLVWNDGIKEMVKIQPGSITDNEVKIKYLVQGKVITIKPENIKAYGYSKNSSTATSESFHYDRLEMEYPA